LDASNELEARPAAVLNLKLSVARVLGGVREMAIEATPACECCGEPSGEGNALCPACAESR
jgi:hypothetical protein